MGGDDVCIARQIINLDDDALLVDFAKAPVSPKSVEADRNICEINSVSVAFTPQNKLFKIALILLTDCRKAKRTRIREFCVKKSNEWNQRLHWQAFPKSRQIIYNQKTMLFS